MKKILIIIIVVIVGMIIYLFNSSNKPYVGQFNINSVHIQWGIDHFPSDKNVGKINNANTAIKKAKELWIEKYGVINGKPYDPTQGREVTVAYDDENECWLVQGTLPDDINFDGAAPNALEQFRMHRKQGTT
ncbi:MAG: YbbC/YhhH family protein [Clostridia bacterium]|nr:YbbC/YhhH family protein [Clostridia bacterium]